MLLQFAINFDSNLLNLLTTMALASRNQIKSKFLCKHKI